jgi:hypothetical protein
MESVKLSLYLYHAIKAYEEVDVWVHSFWTFGIS